MVDFNWRGWRRAGGNGGVGEYSDGGSAISGDIYCSPAVWLFVHKTSDDNFQRRAIGQPDYETDLLYLACLVALVIGGSGPLSIDDWLIRRANKFGVDTSQE